MPCPGICRPAAVSLASLTSILLRFNSRLCVREHVLLRVDKAITAGRDRAARREGKLDAATKVRNPDLESRPPDLLERDKTPLPREQVDALIGRN